LAGMPAVAAATDEHAAHATAAAKHTITGIAPHFPL